MSKTEKTEKCLYIMLTSQGRLGLQEFFSEQILNDYFGKVLKRYGKFAEFMRGETLVASFKLR